MLSSSSLISKRGVQTARRSDYLYDKFTEIHANKYNRDENPNGIVNLGTAINSIMENEVCQRLNQGDALLMNSHHSHYCNFSGTTEMRRALADFINRHFKPIHHITAEKISMMCGATGCLDGLAHALCNPGDMAITHAPNYNRIITDFLDVANVKMNLLDTLIDEEDSSGDVYKLLPDALERRIKELREDGHRVPAFIFVNPSNPTGDVHSPILIAQLLDVCARNEIQMIVDEVYGLSVHDENTEFRSVLSLDLPDPKRTHVIWSMSKDFGLAGLRVGAVLSECSDVHRYFHNACPFRTIPGIIQQAATTLLNDTVWCDEFYFPTYRKRLARNYQIACRRLEEMGASVRRAPAGLFVWFNVKSFLRSQTMEEDYAFVQETMKAGLFLLPGKVLYSTSPGWMRLVFSVTEAELHEGLNRLEKVLTARKLRMSV